MAVKEETNTIPKKFRKLDKSFLNHLQEKNNQFFMSFPKSLSFAGKDKGENIILVVRGHWIVYLRPILIGLLLLVLVGVVTSFLPEESKLFILSLWIIAILTNITIFVYSFVRWFYNVNIITDQRVIDLDFTSALAHTSSEARLERIEDVTHKQIGFVSSVFDIGTLYIQTAGAKAEIEFDSIPRPREVQDILYDLLESKQKGEI